MTQTHERQTISSSEVDDKLLDNLFDTEIHDGDDPEVI